jgi:hypothetical protein
MVDNLMLTLLGVWFHVGMLMMTIYLKSFCIISNENMELWAFQIKVK